MKNILVALDTSTRAPMVLGQAIALASQNGATLHLYRSVGLPVELPMDVYSTSASLIDTLLDNASSDLRTHLARVPEAARGTSRAEVASAWDGICRHAKELDADLIVIGSHGYGGLDLLIGTTAARVVNHADRSVLVVRDKLTIAQ